MPRFLSLACVLALALAVGTSAAAAPTDDETPPLEVSVTDGAIVWTPTLAYGHLTLVISGPDGVVARRSYAPAEAPSLDLAALGLPDGEYTYEATLSGLDGEHETVVQSGEFVWLLGALSVQDAAMVFFHIGDGSIDGSLCIGLDCNSNEAFGFDTLRLKENNLRIHFNDTSTSASFPTADWRIRINDSNNGGENYFGIEDSDSGTVPFRVRQGAGNHALYVSSSGGNVGMGTDTPVVELHIADGDTPTMRLEQNGTNGWTPQTWDVAGNETNFFIRDVTNGSSLPFRIRPSTPANSIYMDTNGVGIRNTSPSAPLDVEGHVKADSADIAEFFTATTFNQAATFLEDVDFDRDATVRLDLTVNRDFFAERFVLFEDNYDATDNIFRINDRNNSSNPSDDVELLRVDGNGDLFLNGSVNPPSSVHLKTDFLPVDNAQVLRAVRALPLTTWRYTSNETGARHMGPMSQDFYAAFGLGVGETTIATVDADGVALASIQALAAENDALRARLAELERLVAEIAAQNQ